MRVPRLAVARSGQALALVALLVTAAGAMQNPAPQIPPPGQPTPQPPGGGGRGRGRGAIQVMTLTTTAWPDGGSIPAKHAQPGRDVSPPLTWSGGPDAPASYVLIVHDLDAPAGNGLDDALHWLVWNIPGTTKALPEGVPQGATLPDGSRQISMTGPNYRGPGAPASGPPHHYVFEVYALDATIDVPAVGASPAQTRAAVTAAMAGRVRGKGVYVGTFKRTP